MRATKKTTILLSLIIFLVVFSIGITILDSIIVKNEKAVVLVGKDGDEFIFREENPIKLSHTNNFYKNGFDLSVSTATNSKIYFTKDGTTPSQETGKAYSEPIKIRDNAGVKSHTYKFIAYFEDGSVSEILTHTYFIGEKVDERFDTLVFSLSTDPDNLYNYETGIFVEGKLRDEYKEKNPWAEIMPPDPANFNMRGKEWERDVFVEAFESDGTKILSQDAGMRVFGGWSRAMPQKSIKLFARSEYDEVNSSFKYEFFPTVLSKSGEKIGKYKRLTLRNCANDENFAFLRDETISALAQASALLDTQASRPVAVFLNGEYYGFAWLHEVYDDNYMDDNYGVEDGDWAILEGGEFEKNEDDTDAINEKAIEDYDHMYSYAYKDLNDDKVFAELNELLDIENFMLYYGIQSYVANGDWPNGNYKCYRYYPKEGEELTSDVPLDGKWRYLLYDTDFGLGLYDNSPNTDSIGKLMGVQDWGKSKSDLFIALMKREDTKAKFINIMADIMNDSFSPTNIEKIVRIRENERMNELVYSIKVGKAADWFDINQLDGRVDEVIKFGKIRPMSIKRQLKNYLGANTEYTLNATPTKNATIYVNTVDVMETDGIYTGTYFEEAPVKLTAKIGIGDKFSHWVINGVKYIDEEVTIYKDMISNSTLNVELVTSKDKEGQLVISAVSFKGLNDFVVLHNPYGNSISTKNIYVSDDSGKPKKLLIPTTIIKPNESLTIYCDNYSLPDSIFGISAPFNLKEGETLSIFDADGNALDSITLGNNLQGNMLKRDFVTNKYSEISVKNYTKD